MKIIDIKVLRGPNIWSTYRKQLIQMKLDLEEAEHTPSDTIPGFAERLEQLIPSLYEHECSEQHPGGFFERVREGTWFGHIIEHIALELQTLAGMECGYGRTRSTKQPGVYHVVFAYEVEQAGIYAGNAAVQIVEALRDGKEYNLEHDIRELRRINIEKGIGPSTAALIGEAKRRDIPWRRLDDDSLIMFGYGKNQKLIKAAIASTTSGIGIDIADNKEDTRRILSEGLVPVPPGRMISKAEDLRDAVEQVGWPVVIKPLNANHGKGVTTNIASVQEAERAFEFAKQFADDVIVEKFIKGKDYRLLVINYKLVAAAKRIPAMVTGNDESSIAELIAAVNRSPARGDAHENALTMIQVDPSTESILASKQLTLHSVLPKGEQLFLKTTANLSTGGTSRDVTHLVHPANVVMAERIARIMNLDICGIDIIAEDINIPIGPDNGAVVEVNAAPGLRMHLYPTKGNAQNVAAPIIDMLYPDGAPSRIPIVAVTGTNGKTTTTRLIAHIAAHAGHRTGYTTTDGICIDGHMVYHGDCSGPSSATVVLKDPIVDYAVLECARGGILRSGLGYDKCDAGIVTNITDDHLGLDDIDSLEDLARVKGVIANSVAHSGYAILNADDNRVYAMRKEVDSKVALFSMDNNNPRITEHCLNGGLAAVVEDGYFTIRQDKWNTRILKIDEVPLTLNGRAQCMVKNILPAILASKVTGISCEKIRTALRSFVPSPEMTPGRMNIFKFRSFQLMIDYAHNNDGFKELGKFVEATPASMRIGIVGCPGDRRDEDIRSMGAIAAGIFDKIIIRHDDDGRGRSNNEITELLKQGIREVNPKLPVKVISDELEAIRYALDMAPKEAFIIVTSDKTYRSIQFVSNALERERAFHQNRNN